MAVLLTFPLFRPLNAAGTGILVGGKLYAYAAGTSTPLATYNEAGAANAHPTILDSAGMAHIRLGASAYKLDLFDALDVHQPGWPVDNIVVGAVWPVAVVTVPSVAGAAVLTAAAVIPAGVPVLVVSTKILTGFGTSNGLTGFQVGDGVSQDRWGNQTILTVGALSGSSDAPAANQAHDASMPRYSTPQAVIISAIGGTFDAVGSLEITVQYLTLPHRSS